MPITMTDPRPYLIAAHVQWLDDNGADPHVVLQNGPKTDFPPALKSHSVVTFNISSVAIVGLHIDEQGISFSARFSGKEHKVYAPLDCMVHLCSRDGQININLQQGGTPPPLAQQEALVAPAAEPVKQEKPKLSVVQGGASDGARRGKLQLVPSAPAEGSEPEQA